MISGRHLLTQTLGMTLRYMLDMNMSKTCLLSSKSPLKSKGAMSIQCFKINNMF